MYKYFHFTSSQMGNRYFKVDVVNRKVYQICVSSGTLKKGRPHCEGIYKIAYSSFLGSYYWYFNRKPVYNTSMVLTSENQYEKALQKVIEQFQAIK